MERGIIGQNQVRNRRRELFVSHSEFVERIQVEFFRLTSEHEIHETERVALVDRRADHDGHVEVKILFKVSKN